MSEKEDKNAPKHRLVEVTDNISLKDSVSVIKNSVLEGYNRLSETFNPQQVNLANTVKFEENLRKFAESTEKLVTLTEEQREDSKEDTKRERKYFYISTAIAIITTIIAIISILK